MDKWTPMYDGDEEPDDMTKTFDDKAGAILGAVQTVAQIITAANDVERWSCLKTCLYALIAAGDGVMDEHSADPTHDN